MANVKAILGEKLGMTQIFSEDGRAVPVTVLKAGPCVVTQVRTPEKDGYVAVQLSFGDIAARKVRKPAKGQFDKAGAPPSKHLVELRTDDGASYTLGQELKADVFAPGDFVDVIGVSKGKGFAGNMKRWNFAGMPKTHGTEKKHRQSGSVGAGTTPGRVFKGKKMPGHLGHERVTVLNLRVVEADPEQNLLLVRGAVPGHNGTLVMVRSAVKKGAHA
ncbi:MAG: 50S ribosomal protein L3 [Actinomycetota bacterium]|nr:50S ribosomal protein L3 [Actinomycetota bacterium]